MTENQNDEPVVPAEASPSEQPASAAAVKSPPRWPLYLVFLVGLSIPLLFFYQTWFGVVLNDTKLEQYFQDTEKGRHIQHALEEMTRRMESDLDTAVPFYKYVVLAAGHPDAPIRSMAAWTMGFDNAEVRFHEALIDLLEDDIVTVRFNAALSLSKFQEGQARPNLQSMLRAYPVQATESGTITGLLKDGKRIEMDAQVALILPEGGVDDDRISVLAPLRGTVTDIKVHEGDSILQGEVICSLVPSWAQVWEGLRAMYLVGMEEDLDDVRRYTKLTPGMPEALHQQALLTEEEIVRRASEPLPIYNKPHDFKFQNYDGRNISLQDLQGQPWVASFIFTNCSGSCPVLTAKMKGVQDAVEDTGPVKLVSITFDPERDSLEVLQEFAKSYDADPQRWFFLRGDKADVFLLCKDGFKLPVGEATEEDIRNGEEVFLHSQRLMILDGEHRIRGYYNSFDDDCVEKMVRDLKRLRKENIK